MASTAWRAACERAAVRCRCARIAGLACVALGVDRSEVRGEFLPDRVGGRRPIVVEAREPGLQRAFARRTHFVADRVVVTQIERAQERPQRQALEHQRAQDDRERGQHDQVAIREARRQAPAPPPARRCRACRPTR